MTQKGEERPLYAPGPLDLLARAKGDLRRGLIVGVEAGDGILPVLAAERAQAHSLAALAALTGAPLCVILSHTRAATLKIPLYTPGVVAVPLREGDGTAVIRHLADPASDLASPMLGPFKARRDPLPKGAAAAVALAKQAELLPALVAPIAAGMWADAMRRASLMMVSAADIEAFADRSSADLEMVVAADVPLAGAPKTRIVAFRPGGGGAENLAIIVGDPDLSKPVLVRLHSECFTGDLLGSLKCDCGEQLKGAIARMGQEGSGILLYLAQEGRGIGLLNKLRAYALQDQGFDTVEANERLGFNADERDFSLAAAMLKALGVKTIRLLTNNPDKLTQLSAHGINVTVRVPHAFASNPHNERYLATKAQKSGHQL